MNARTTTEAVFESPAPPEGAWVGESGFDRLDENLHFGRAWHRYRYCYRPAGPRRLRVLDASCGAGRAAVEAARLNPGAAVLGVDATAAGVEFARERAESAGLDADVTFRAHDPERPLPEEWGLFDFVICRGRLARTADPGRLAANLATALDPAGLVYLSLPSRAGRAAARSLRLAIEAVAPESDGEERLRLGVELLQAFHHDHPVRARLSEFGSQDGPERFVAGCFNDLRDWTFEEAEGLLAAAGLRLLYAATPWQWRPDRVFAPASLADSLQSRLDRLGPEATGRLVDALDPSMFGGDYRLYACHAGYTPAAPDWPVTRHRDPRIFERLVPHRTGLTAPVPGGPGAPGGRLLYRSVSGSIGELDRWSGLLLGAADGETSCGEIEKALAARTRASDDGAARHDRWIHLADSGLVFLEPPPGPLAGGD